MLQLNMPDVWNSSVPALDHWLSHNQIVDITAGLLSLQHVIQIPVHANVRCFRHFHMLTSNC